MKVSAPSVFSVWPLSTSVWGGKPKPCLRSGRVSRVVSYSSDQPLVSEPLPGNAINETVEAVERVASHVAIVEPESKFINVAVKVLFAHMMIDAIDAALQHRENAFDAIGGYIVTRVFARAMVDGLMLVGR